MMRSVLDDFQTLNRNSKSLVRNAEIVLIELDAAISNLWSVDACIIIDLLSNSNDFFHVLISF